MQQTDEANSKQIIASLPDAIWQFGNDVSELYDAAGDLALGLEQVWDLHDATAPKAIRREAVFVREVRALLDALREKLASIRKRSSLLRHFAFAYKNRLGDYYISPDNWCRARIQNPRPPEMDPLDYRYLSYTDKAIALVDQFLAAISGARNNIECLTEAIPFALDLTFDPRSKDEFVAELRQETARAASLAAANAADGDLAQRFAHEGEQLHPENTESSDDASLSAKDESVLRALLKHVPRLLTIESICEEADCSRDTATDSVNALIKSKLAHRPNGDRRGATITELGCKVATRLPPPPPRKTRRRSGAKSNDISSVAEKN